MTLKISRKIYTLESKRLSLRTLQLSDNSERYLGWLNDPEVQKYTRRRGRISTAKNIEDFIKHTLGSTDFHFAVFIKDIGVHIGNCSLNSVDELNNSAEVSIMLGDRTIWSQGYGSEAIQALIDFAFGQLSLHRLWAESCNPSFIVLMKKLHWLQEGVRRDAVRLDGKYVDYIDWSILKGEWLKK